MDSIPASIHELEARSRERGRTNVGLIISALDGLFEVILDLKIVTLPCFEREPFGFRLQYDRPIAKRDENIDLAELLAFLPQNIDVRVYMSATEHPLQTLLREILCKSSSVCERRRRITRIAGHPIEGGL